MSATELSKVEVGFQVFVADGGEEIGAVREIRGGDLVIYVENAGEFTVTAAAITAVHSQKVVLDPKHLDGKLKTAIGHAHDAEEPGL